MAGNGMKGMNIERGREVSQQITVRIDMVEQEIQRLNGVKGALESNWAGADQQAMIARIDENIQLNNTLKDVLGERKTELDQDIQEQEQTSGQ